MTQHSSSSVESTERSLINFKHAGVSAASTEQSLLCNDDNFFQKNPSEGSSRRAICHRCSRPTPQACICEALPNESIELATVEVVILQHPLEIKQHKATANRSVPLLELCLSPTSLSLCVGRRLGDEIDGTIMEKLNHRTDQYQPVLVFPKLNMDTITITLRKENEAIEDTVQPHFIYSLNGLIDKLKRDQVHPADGGATNYHKKKVLLLVLDATWKYAREMHMANQKYRQYPSHMLQVALEKEDLLSFDKDNGENTRYRPRRFEIRGKVSARGGKKAADEEDANTTWMSTAECVSLIVSRLEEELITLNREYHIAIDLHEMLMKPLDAMVAKWKAFLTGPKTRKHDVERGISKKDKRRKRTEEQLRYQQQQKEKRDV